MARKDLFMGRARTAIFLFILSLPFGHMLMAQDGDTETPSKAEKKAEADALPESGLIRLESTFVGDKEQPSVSYFIPWQGTGSPDGLKWQIERLNDDSLSLVDREIMLRSMNIYNEMNLE